MRISNDYFERLLYSNDPLTALHELDGIWCARLSKTRSYSGLSVPEFDVHVYLVYQGEVGNGGHRQFFLNATGGLVLQLLKALERLDFQHVRQILEQGTSVFPNGFVPTDFKECETAVEQLGETQLKLWNRLDQQLYAIDSQLWQPLLAYLQFHHSEVLLPERGLA